MKTKCIVLTSLLTATVIANSIAQDLVEKNYFDKNKELGGEVEVKNSAVKIDGVTTFRTFEVEAPDEGEYYLSVWLMASKSDQEYRSYEVLVNDEQERYTITPEKSNWHNARLKDNAKNLKSIKLRKGLNRVSFLGRTPEVPMIEFIRLSKDKIKASISNTKYENFVGDIRKEMQSRGNDLEVKKDTLLTLRNGVILSNPDGNYYQHIGATFKYTYYTTAYFQAGQQAFFTTNATNFKHVLEVFSYNRPDSYSWVTTSNTSNMASININIPYSDYYFIRVRSYYQGEQGLVDLNINGQYYYEDCTASGFAGFRHPHETPTTYNYFTSHITGDTRLWIEADDGMPGRIIGWNDDYNSSGDYYWGLSSRVKKDFNVRVGGVLFSSYSSYTPTGTCDLYIMCQNSDIVPYFPNLKSDDAIQSAPATSSYNCISWTGGITNDWHWPPSPFDPYYAGSPLASFDNFYGSADRYEGCMTYTRTGATFTNSIVDLWSLNGEYTHGSCTKPTNNHPHGYDWESKPGGLMRTLHPRNALNGPAYGSANDYYIQNSSLKSAMLLDESIARGLSAIENIELTDTENNTLSNKINDLTINQKDEFEHKYTAWKQTWEDPKIAIQSNPRMYTKSKEYQELINYCKSQGKSVWPLIFDKFQHGDFFTINALEDLTLTENQDILEKVKNESSLKSITESGAKIVRFPRTIAMKYIKELLNSPDADKTTKDEGITYSNSFKFNVSPNPANATSQISFALSNDSRVSAQIIDLNGKVISIILKEQVLADGSHSFNLNIPENCKGMYIVKLMVNDNVNAQLIAVD